MTYYLKPSHNTLAMEARIAKYQARGFRLVALVFPTLTRLPITVHQIPERHSLLQHVVELDYDDDQFEYEIVV
jgi:hypothetical protein